jgi:flagellar biosynthesis protein FliR
MRGLKHVILMSLALGMLFYSLPQLEIHIGFSLPTVFAVVWICLALLVVAAHLHEILAVEDDGRRQSKLEQRPKSGLKGGT